MNDLIWGSASHRGLVNLHDHILIHMPEGGEAPGLEHQLIMLADPFSRFYKFLLEETTIETDLLEYLLAELHHLPSLVHHHNLIRLAIGY